MKDAGYNPEMTDKAWLENVIAILQGKCELLSDIKNLIGMFFEEVQEPDEETDALLRSDDSKKAIEVAYDFINNIESDNATFTGKIINHLKEKAALKGKGLFMPLRGILTGRLKGPELDAAVPVIGIEKCRKRIEFMYKKYIKV